MNQTNYSALEKAFLESGSPELPKKERILSQQASSQAPAQPLKKQSSKSGAEIMFASVTQSSNMSQTPTPKKLKWKEKSFYDRPHQSLSSEDHCSEVKQTMLQVASMMERHFIAFRQIYGLGKEFATVPVINQLVENYPLEDAGLKYLESKRRASMGKNSEHYWGFIKLPSQKHITVKSEEPTLNLKSIKEMSSLERGRITNIDRISYAIHHRYSHRGLYLVTMLFFAPIITFFFGVTYLSEREIMQFDNLSYLQMDLRIVDTLRGIIRIYTVYWRLVEVRRMVLEGFLQNDSFQKWGIKNIEKHIDSLIMKNLEESAAIVETLIVLRLIQESKFSRLYKWEQQQVKMIPYLYFQEETQSLFMVEGKLMEIVEYNQMVMQMVLRSNYSKTHILGPNKDRRAAPLEEVLRFNCLNPLLFLVTSSKLV